MRLLAGRRRLLTQCELIQNDVSIPETAFYVEDASVVYNRAYCCAWRPSLCMLHAETAERRPSGYADHLSILYLGKADLETSNVWKQHQQ